MEAAGGSDSERRKHTGRPRTRVFRSAAGTSGIAIARRATASDSRVPLVGHLFRECRDTFSNSLPSVLLLGHGDGTRRRPYCFGAAGDVSCGVLLAVGGSSV